MYKMYHRIKKLILIEVINYKNRCMHKKHVFLYSFSYFYIAFYTHSS